MRKLLHVFLPVAIILASTFASSAMGQAVTSKQGLVATVHPVATDAGIAALSSGGNAIDAAIAAAVTLGVVDAHNSGLGGGCFVLIRTSDGNLVAIDGREMAPAAATRDMYLRDGKVVPGLSTTGPLAVGVPGALAAYTKASSKYGRLELSGLLNRAAEIADKGFAVDRVFARNLVGTREQLLQFPASKELLLKPDGSVYAEGETLRLPALASTYRKMASDPDWFYRGEFARTVGDWMATHGGLITAADFANYVARDREPVVTNYRDHTIVGFPPPSSGGIHVAQILNILEHFPMDTWMRDDPVKAQHVIAEAMKLAFADRAHWLGDADFAKVPRGLAGKSYAKTLASRINVDVASNVDSHGLPPNWESDVYGKHTTHIAAADAEGNWVAITATVNTSFGSKVVVPGTGLVLNNEMDDFSAQPGMPNAFGLVGAEANAVAPGKRPLSSMSPTIVLRNDKPVLTVGGAGGPKIITAVLLAIVRSIDGGLPVADCIGQPRMHHQWRPDLLFLEKSFEPRVVNELRAKGHKIQFLESGGVAQAITQLPNGLFLGVSDPRVPGKASGL